MTEGAYRSRMASSASTAEDYLASLPADRRAAISAVRDVVNANLPQGYEESMVYGMISWVVPLSVKPDTYNKQPLTVASLASQKGHMALYLMGVYGNKRVDLWFRKAFASAGKKLDMGKSCVRFKALDDLPLSVIGEVITKIAPAELIAAHDLAHGAAARARKARAAAQTLAKKPVAKRPAAKPNTKAAAKPKTKPTAKPAAKPTVKSAAKNKPADKRR